MNALCRTDLPVRDRPFETLDTTTRCLTRHSGDVLLSDTVGFIRRLPDRLYASFESTMAIVFNKSDRLGAARPAEEISGSPGHTGT